MSTRRKLGAVAGILVGMVTAIAVQSPAHAATTANHAAGARSAAVVRPMTSSPTISPSVSTTYLSSGQTLLDPGVCESGALCAAAWDPFQARYKVFHMVACHTYAVSFWNGTGSWYDHQTGTPLSTFLNQSMKVINPPGAFLPSSYSLNFDWTPVWYIKNC